MKTRLIYVTLICLLGITGQAQAGGEELVLVEVNDDVITGADLDRLIMEAHGEGMDGGSAEGLVPKLLEKAIRDRLILQDAYSMGMGDDPLFTKPSERAAIRKAISLYTRSQVELPEVSDAEIREYFETYYHQIQMRQMSLDSAEACRDAMDRIRSGEVTMGTLATQESLDPLKLKGGLQNQMYWADVDFDMRAASESLEPGGFSEPFEYKGRWTFIRVESRTPIDPDEYTRRENYIRGVLRNYKYEIVWAEMVERHLDQVEVQVDDALLAGVRADEDILFRGEFRDGSQDPVIWIDEDHALVDQEFRISMSKRAMQMGDSPFEEILEVAVREQTEQLVLAWFAERAGYFEDPEVQDVYTSRLESAMLNAYLEENIGLKIVLDPDEYRQFYEDHKAEFTGPEEIRMSVLTSADEQLVREASQRLSEGADFDYVRAEVEGRESESASKAESWSPITVFSDEIIEAMQGMKVGDASPPIRFGYGWMIFRLDGRRPGSVAPIEEVDKEIRSAMFYQEFQEMLDEHLARLESASVIVRHEDRVREWARSES